MEVDGRKMWYIDFDEAELSAKSPEDDDETLKYINNLQKKVDLMHDLHIVKRNEDLETLKNFMKELQEQQTTV